MTTDSTPTSSTSFNLSQLELIKRDLCTTITTLNGGQAIALMLAESDDETTANVARAAYGFLQHLHVQMDSIYSALGDIR
ncbi:hypothetical protein [Gynuella sunshinyii]|uniref:Uncharacterized protein n=1 Tax=Gynuella sunshinyii YC6258 TaxID=1445510 RepID=A0A0C5VHM3_9GAMM|nr:hypothetical protein [Gynuella sunshinyii]AJQ94167.1 hypothetical Protein YC6258_02129 [Gynuella sunshinyii YC6258]